LKEMCLGTRYYKNEERKEAILQHRVDLLLSKLEKFNQELNEIIDAQLCLEVDRHINVLEAIRDLSHTWIHVDMDAFYAAVEILSKPHLQGKPVAVGSMDMLATSNYEARKWGVRAGIPGFLAIQLCPLLEIIPLDFAKYRHYSGIMRSILEMYDPNFQSSSLDEADLDITEYLSSHTSVDAVDVAKDIQLQIVESTGLTCSMGIAATNLLAKICAEVNKPNGFFHLPSSRDNIVGFLQHLPVRKVPGVGKVMERLLQALEVKTCGQIFESRYTISKLFSPSLSDFFMRAALGIAEKRVKGGRKSMSREKTFRDFYEDDELLLMCKEIAADLAAEMESSHFQAKTITLKLKTIDFEIKNKSINLDRCICKSEDIYSHASELLQMELPIDLRTLGIKLSDLEALEVE